MLLTKKDIDEPSAQEIERLHQISLEKGKVFHDLYWKRDGSFNNPAVLDALDEYVDARRMIPRSIHTSEQSQNRRYGATQAYNVTQNGNIRG